MKRLIFLILFSPVLIYGQNQINTKKATITDWIIYQGDTLNVTSTNGDTIFFIRGAEKDTMITGNHWSISSGNIQNNNVGKVTIDSLYLYPLPPLATPRAIGRVLGVETNGQVKWNYWTQFFKNIPTSTARGLQFLAQQENDSSLFLVSWQEIINSFGMDNNCVWASAYSFTDADEDFDTAYATYFNLLGEYDIHVGDSVIVGWRYIEFSDCGNCDPPVYCDSYDTSYYPKSRITAIDTLGGDTIQYTVGYMGGVDECVINTDCTFPDPVCGYFSVEVFTRQCQDVENFWDRTGNYLFPKSLEDSVGIGTTTPIERLDVNGNINMPLTASSSGQWKQNGVTMFHSYHEGSNTNMFFGEYSGNMSADSSYNIGIGAYDLENLTNGYNNIAIGNITMSSLTNGYYNIGIGHNTLRLLETGYRNIAIGDLALVNLGNLADNLAIGFSSQTTSTIGGSNVSIGNYTLLRNVTGGYNVALGDMAMSGNIGTTTGHNYNVSVGALSLYSISNGADRNTAIGYLAGDSLSTGDGNVFIGNEAGGQVTTESNRLYIDNTSTSSPLIYGDFSTDQVRINGEIQADTLVLRRSDGIYVKLSVDADNNIIITPQ